MKNPGIATDRTGTERTENSKDSLSIFLENIQSRKYEPYQTGLKFFDDLLGGGLLRKTLTILLAAPGAGKTALCAQVAEAIAEHKHPVLYLNLEMPADQMLARSISGRATAKSREPITAVDVLQGYAWTDIQREIITDAIEEYRRDVLPFMEYRREELGTSVEELRRYLDGIGESARAAGKPAPVVILDYLHLVTGAGDPQELIKQVTFMLKVYAEKYETLVIAIAAINRDSIKDGRVTQTSGRDSSGIEFTADNLLSLNFYECEVPAKIRAGEKMCDNPEHVDPTNPEEMGRLLRQPVRRMILRVLKGRLTEPGKKIDLQFYAPGARFYEKGAFIPVHSVPFKDEQQEDEEDLL